MSFFEPPSPLAFDAATTDNTFSLVFFAFLKRNWQWIDICLCFCYCVRANRLRCEIVHRERIVVPTGRYGTNGLYSMRQHRDDETTHNRSRHRLRDIDIISHPCSSHLLFLQVRVVLFANNNDLSQYLSWCAITWQQRGIKTADGDYSSLAQDFNRIANGR